MSTGAVVGGRQRAVEGRVTLLERELENVRDEVRMLAVHMAFLTRRLDAARADNGPSVAVLGTESVRL